MRRHRALLVAALVAMVATALAAATAGVAGNNATIKAAWIYVGPHNDGGWSQAHDRGRLFVQKKMGSAVKTTYKENVPEGPQAAQVIDSLVRDGNKIIFATSFGYMDAMAAAAKKYPDVYFEHATGYKTAKNYANYFGAGEDSIYLSGIAAGAATKKGVVGYIVPFPIPEIIRHANAFALGVQLVKPNAKVKLVWTKSWFDPGKERKAAESLVAAGADVIGQNVDGTAAGQYAQSKKLPWVGYNSDSRKFAPTSWLVAGVYDWGPYYLKRVKAAANGTLEDRQLLGHDGGRLHDALAVRPEGHRQDEGDDRGEAEGSDQRLVLRVHRPVVRPERQAPRGEGQADDVAADPLDGLARQGCRGEPQGLERTGEPSRDLR